MTAYSELEHHYRRISHLTHAEAILTWDEAAMMPEGGGDARAEALASLRGLVHERSTDPKLADLIARAESDAGALDEWQAANLREMKRGYVRSTALPQELVEASSRAETKSSQAWRALRPKNDFASYRPFLEEVVARKREMAAALADKLTLSPYDALLDAFEPGATSERVTELFRHLRSVLPPLIERVLEKQSREPTIEPKGPFPVERQRWLAEQLMRLLGFDFARGRLDMSHHPFCGGVPQDVRITTRYDAADFSRSLMGVLHETGHAKYEQNLPGGFIDQPVGAARGMALHESQSLLLEMQVCRGRAFFELARPLIVEAFAESARREPGAFTVENLHRAGTRVRRSLIRVDADEVTYPCHVILRFEIEKPLIDGELRVRDIPELWDAKMRELLKLSTAGNDRDGCLQDIHWPEGLFGYFPTYTLGALAAAQLYRAARDAHPELDSEIVRGDLSSLDEWLRERVWSRGSRFASTDELLQHATSLPLSTNAFETHLRERYLDRG